MTSFPFAAGAPFLSTVVEVWSARGPMKPQTCGVFAKQRLSTDPIGTATVTFSGINADSEIRIYLPDGTEAAGVENCDADHVLTWDAYSQGNANNTVTIRIVHPDYEIQEFTYTTQVGNQSIPIQQLPDRWYSNPA
jgi:hypothetical protein